MAAIRRRDTKMELEVRSILHRAGLRFRVDMPIRVGANRPIRPDIIFTRRRLAVFCDGCFWHGCALHGQRPAIQHPEYWNPKIEGNRQRDLQHTALLRSAGWTVLRFWEHDAPRDVTNEIISVSNGLIGHD